MQWKPEGTAITVTVPGLYVLSCGFFSQGPFVATVRISSVWYFFKSLFKNTATIKSNSGAG